MKGLVLLLLLGACGCTSMDRPHWFQPGTARSQQTKALRYDPYPENEPGPTMVGARPREYQKPPPECSRARWQLGKWGE